MNLHQFKFIQETIRHNFNLTEAARALYTSQPGISKAIIELENELGLRIFERYGKRIKGLTQQGKEIIKVIDTIMHEIDNLKKLSNELSQPDDGTLLIGCTHTQARYYLPDLILKFKQRYPKVKISIVEGNPEQLAKMVLQERADIVFATETLYKTEGLVTLPCYDWHHVLVMNNNHPLTELTSSQARNISLETIAQYPIITYDPKFSGRSKIDAAFQQAGLQPEIILEAIDSDVIKTYVNLGMGVGIIAEMAFDPRRDQGMSGIPVGHLFGTNRTHLAFRKDIFIRAYIMDFLIMCSSGMDRDSLFELLERV
ncbi:CysB family HTH-type transcriptional regulator [Brackiella oedipodis]|uniref:CysB family HTH-type transcriptional regulator n=1 Tax=Brackiella oedipodis TaxID=124225 RepID=UPI00048FB4AB|nr:CysB family HTH-type transcriptional regulator [Brackiella oedipodis]